uniref:Centrosomal protein 20 n=1 Tax=Petromyzon marinus TaxID=7757 RepID=A0AAJ7THQ7_PETMA|nr:lisH domain-containing protein FOPNL [Petromyzon marinus]
MATVEELRSAVRESLERRGVLAATRARLRAEVFTSLAEPETARPPLPHENLLLNELIHEYLSYNQYNYTAGVLVTEAGQPDTRLERDFLARELHVLEEPSARSVPLLYGMLAHFMSRGAGVNASQAVPMPGGSRGLQRSPSPSRVPQKIATAGDTGVEEPAMTQFVVRGGYR